MTSPTDTLTSKTVQELLSEKYILILGDSVVRGLYKDLIRFTNSDDLLNEEELCVKGENRFYGDRLIHGGNQKGLTNGIDYEEVREYSAGGRLRLRYYFLTRCYSSYLKDVIFNDIKNQTIKPDIIIMNSCLWDISRYGIYSMRSYQRNLDRIMGSFRQMLPDALFLWLSALPVSNASKGGVIVSSAEYIRPILPGLIRDGNYHCSQMCDIHGVLYINLHTIFSTMLHLRRPDGIHWNTIGIRLMNEIILNHIKTYYYGVKNFNCSSLREELGNKIKKLKEEIKKSTHKSKINYLDLDMSDDDDNNKRKRNDHDDEKENNRKVIIKSSNQNEKRMVIIKKVIDDLNIQQEEYDKFDHEYSDVMYDNEFEGLHLLHFSSYDIEPLEDIENLPINYLNSQIDIKPSLQSLIIQKEQIDKSDFIDLSLDDNEDETTTTTTTHIVPSNLILPVYLLNHFE